MQRASRVLMIAVAAGCLSIFGLGCEADQKTDAEHAEHPQGEHPQGEHPDG